MARKGAAATSDVNGLAPRTVFQTTGRRKQVVIKGDDGSELVLIKHSKFFQLGSQWTYELVTNSGAIADKQAAVKLTLVKSGWRPKVTITDTTEQATVELVSGGELFQRRFVRKFAWNGREYQWEHPPQLFGDTRFILIDLDSKVTLAERTLSNWSWEPKGTITIFNLGGDVIPTAWILATALAMEQLWREKRSRRHGAISAATAAGASGGY